MTRLATRIFRLIQFNRRLSLEGPGRWLLSSCDDGVRVFDASSGSILYQHGHGSSQALFAGRWLVVSRRRPSPALLLVSPEDFSQKHEIRLDTDPQALAASADGAWLACWTKDGLVAQIRIDGDVIERRTLRRPPSEDVVLAFSPDSKRLVAAYHERDARSCVVELFSLAPPVSPAKKGAKGKATSQDPPTPFASEGELKGARSAVHTLVFSPDGAELIACTTGTVLAWALPAGKARTLLKCKNYPRFVGFHGDSILLTDSQEAIVSVALASGAERWRHPHYGPAAMNDKRVVHSRFLTLTARDPQTGAAQQQGDVESFPDHLVVDEERGCVHVAASAGQLVRRWSLATGGLEPHPQGWGGDVHSAIFVGDRVIVGTKDPAVLVWEPPRLARLIDRPAGVDRFRLCNAIEPDGDSLWMSVDREVFWWNAATGQHEARSDDLRESVVAMHHAADLKTLVVCTSNYSKPGKLHLLDPRTLKSIYSQDLYTAAVRIERAQGPVVRIFSRERYVDFDVHQRRTVALSPDLHRGRGDFIFSPGGGLAVEHISTHDAKRDRDKYFFRVHAVTAARTALHEPRPLPSSALLTFLDAGRLLSVHEDALRGWSVATGEPLFEVLCETFSPARVWAAPDGRRALVAGGDGSYDVYDLPPA